MTEWRDSYDVHAPRSMDEPFTVGAVGEIDFAERELGLAPGAHVLGVGCGAGRHSVKLARVGYRVTPLDLPAGMLEQACAAAGIADLRARRPLDLDEYEITVIARRQADGPERRRNGGAG
ncbi:MAG: methyltransferase domain-containing protein [Thermoleophilia bacterium]|nr:methyltransferase domain-containing protein [Thermoleophilia bacterium]